MGLVGLGDRTPLRHAYQNTVRCAGVLSQQGATVTGKYCGNRWCLTCNAIRTAKLITVYEPLLEAWQPDAYFVTLTVPNVEGPQLKPTILQLTGTLRLIADAIRRTDGLRFQAVRKLEVTWNPRRRTYHPHLHLVVRGRAAADALVRRWLSAFPTAVPEAQQVRQCDAGGVAELFKYFTKLLVKGMDGQRTAPPAWVLDTIFKAVRGLRTFQPMGVRLSALAVTAIDETVTLDAATLSPSRRADDAEPTTWHWLGYVGDWIDLTTGELLSGYEPTPQLRELLIRIRRDLAVPPPSSGKQR